jgi:sugar lactone lactonase YvrE
LSPRDGVYRIAANGVVETVIDGHGRPQGLAFDAQGRLYVVEALAGDAGIWRYDVASGDTTGEKVLAAGALVGLAFDPDGGLVAAGPDTIWRVDVPLRPLRLI